MKHRISQVKHPGVLAILFPVLGQFALHRAVGAIPQQAAEQQQLDVLRHRAGVGPGRQCRGPRRHAEDKMAWLPRRGIAPPQQRQRGRRRQQSTPGRCVIH